MSQNGVGLREGEWSLSRHGLNDGFLVSLVTQSFPLIWQQVIDFVMSCAGQADENIGEIFLRINTEAKAGLHEACENCRGLSAGSGAREHPIVTADHDCPEGVFRVIVMYFEEAVINKLHERRPVIECVFDRISQGCRVSGAASTGVFFRGEALNWMVPQEVPNFATTRTTRPNQNAVLARAHRGMAREWFA